ncbi:hypothetical protein D9M72_394140 [compost metagenome]
MRLTGCQLLRRVSSSGFWPGLLQLNGTSGGGMANSWSLSKCQGSRAACCCRKRVMARSWASAYLTPLKASSFLSSVLSRVIQARLFMAPGFCRSAKGGADKSISIS